MRLPVRSLLPQTLRLSAAAAVMLVSTALFAQTTQPAQTPEAGLTTLRTRANLVLVDVVVTDPHGNPVKGLKQDTFSLTEDKTPQTIRTFDEHTAPGSDVKFTAMPKLLPGFYTNYAPGPVNSAVNILLLDSLNTPFRDQAVARQQVLKYLKDMKPGTAVAVFNLSLHLSMLQGFTSDPEVLKRVVDGWRPNKSPLLDDRPATGGPASEMKRFDIQERAQDTLDGMNLLARYLSGVPGRKNLIWFAGAFPLSLLPTGDSSGDPFARLISSEREFRETTNMLGRSQVSVYPIDSRGLMVTPMLDPANPGSGAASVNPARTIAAEHAFSTITFDEQKMMDEMASATGGKAFYNTNGIAQAVATAVDNGANYYTLSYTPTDHKQDGSFRTLRVKVASLEGKSGYTLSYRQGYYSDESGSSHSAATPAPPSAFRSATLFGAPPATQILFRAMAQPATKLPESAPATGNSLGKDPKDPAKTIATGPWNRYMIHYSVDGRPVEFTNDPNGSFHGDIECITLVYDSEGTLINSQMNRIQPTLTPTQHAALEGHAMDITQQISVPVKGVYNFRILVHDRNSGKIGALEIPVNAAQKLPAVQAQTTLH